MKTLKRVLAIIAIVLLLGLYAATFILAVLNVPGTAAMFNACVYATIAIPILMYAFWMIIKLVNKK